MQTVTETKVLPGDALIDGALRLVGQCDVKLRLDQIQFIEDCIKACIPIFYKTNLTEHRMRILNRFNLSQVTKNVLKSTHRRWGKSMCLEIVASILMQYCDGVNILVLGANVKLSQALRRNSVERFLASPGADKSVMDDSKKSSVFSSGMMNFIHSAVATMDNLHHVHPDIVIVDEFTFIPEDVMNYIKQNPRYIVLGTSTMKL